MNQLFNIILIIVILIILYKCIQCTKDPENNSQKINIKPNLTIPVIENFIEFDYGLRPIEKEFIKEQKDGVNLNTWYSNTWIDHIDKDGNPVYNSRENVTGEKETIIDGPKSSFSYDFNNTKTTNIEAKILSLLAETTESR